MKLQKKMFGLIIIGLFCATVFLQHGVTHAADNMPKIISISSFGTGSTALASMMALSDGMMKKFGVRIRVIPGANEGARLGPVRNGYIHFSATGQGCWWAWMGRAEFAQMQWGPQELYMIWQAESIGSQPFVAACDANIKTPYDMKGKRLTWIPYSAGHNMPNTAMLAFGNLTWNEVERTTFPSNKAIYPALAAGQVDAMTASGLGGGLHQVAASPRKLCYISMPASDKEGWARFHKVVPYMTPIRKTGCIGMDKNKLYDISTYPYPLILAYGSQDEELVYNMCKMIDESYDLYKDSFLAMPGMKKERGIKAESIAMLPFHKGAVKYFKAIGYWTPEMESANNKLIERFKKQKKMWQDTLYEAGSKAIRGKAFTKMWLEKIGHPEDIEFIK
ncbi:TAXI family TRAP transporter solute-binding subunit [Thermodesulfobacteriota bacterium]